MNIRCIEELTRHLQEDRDVTLEICPELCPSHAQGDITVNCFRLTKALRVNPTVIAERVTTFLECHSDVSAVEKMKGFVNITLHAAALFRDAIPRTLMSTEPILSEKERIKILVEFSAPNTNKPQHLGHVRNNVLGMSFCSLLRRLGHNVVAVNLINDRGIHICKSMLAYQRNPEPSTLKGDHLVGKYYVQFENELSRQLQELKQKFPEKGELSNDRLFAETEIGHAAQEMLQKWERGDLVVRTLWQKLNHLVLDGFQQTYQRLGIVFDHTYYESETYKVGKSLILKDNKNLFYQNDSGAFEVDLESDKLGKKIVLRKDGTSVYITQDIGTTTLKQEDFQPDAMVWVVGNEQIYHFQVLFSILRKMGFSATTSLRHIAYGMVHLPSGKMKSREGIVVDADNLCDQMFQLAEEETLRRHAENPPDNIKERAQCISISALKFMLLKVNPHTTISFDPAEAIKFEGDTGPYIQYAYARIASIFRKSSHNIVSPDLSVLGEPEERILALHCSLYQQVLRKAGETYDTSTLATYLLQLTKSFHRFYRKHSVLSAEGISLIEARLYLCSVVQYILRDGLGLLGINTLEEM